MWIFRRSATHQNSNEVGKPIVGFLFASREIGLTLEIRRRYPFGLQASDFAGRTGDEIHFPNSNAKEADLATERDRSVPRELVVLLWLSRRP